MDGHRFIPGSCSEFLLEYTWLWDRIIIIFLKNRKIVHCVRINLVGLKDIGNKKGKFLKNIKGF